MRNLSVEDVKELLPKIYSRRFGELNPGISRINKGEFGQILEIALGIPNGNSLKDLSNGELKSNKSKIENGKIIPMETMAISQIGTSVDSLLTTATFSNSWVYEKIKRIIYVPAIKYENGAEISPKDWYITKAYDISISEDFYLYKTLEKDFNLIKNTIIEDKRIHTVTGEFMQIRSKDSQPYKPIYSNILNKEMSNKQYAFYFTKNFMKYILDSYSSF